ncbi:S41 family peptidase [Paraflavitalea sp. CAU 1676]|uniref:S41 family peptidase n=1 Tax=Paraflavitalea sp. CAU 1676 TaxID=3032598 RepID=UPI0023DC4711|nr:S41 family peptidase [Paraflavitalea sp. CAU 1676]MDF2193232.1 S41 family peptidase [Paraflavitalea sp. CAU 1676]
MKRAGLIGVCLLFTLLGAARQPVNFSVPQLKEDLAVFRTALREMHPGLYQYHDSVYINKRFATLEQQLIKPMSEEAFFRLLNPLVVDIRDGHTKWHRDQRPDDLFAFHQDGLFPLKLYFKDKKAYVVDGYGNNTVPQGSEVVSINGKTMVAIGNQLADQVIVDGFIEAARYRALSDRFAGYYVSFMGQSPQFAIGYRVKADGAVKTVTLPAVTLVDISTREKLWAAADSWRVSFPADSVALMRIPVFMPQEKGPAFEAFLQSSFATIKASGAQHLILDLRNNEGGLDRWGSLLYSWLVDKPFRYYDRLTVASDGNLSIRQYAWLPDQFDQLKSFIKKEGDEYLFTMNPALGMVNPQAKPFMGKVYVLLNGVSFSVTTEFGAIVRDQKRGLIIGEESGGTIAGNNSGGFGTVKLPNTHLSLGIPLLGYHMSLTNQYPAGSGIIPDHTIVPTVQDIILKNDVVLQKTLQLIQGHR